jgi:hypothetical protein
MGLGFIMGGFCPGTSFTAIAIGKIDGLIFTVGLYLGIYIFSISFPLFSDFYYSGNMGNVTLMDVTGISAQWFAFGFVVVALTAFWVTMLIEKRIRKNITVYKF